MPRNPPSQAAADLPQARERERRSQLRGLLILALLTLLAIFLRASRAAIFHAGWWRF
jgi:hypothetical protein